MSPFKRPEPKPPTGQWKFQRPNAASSQPEAGAAHLAWEKQHEAEERWAEARRLTALSDPENEALIAHNELFAREAQRASADYLAMARRLGLSGAEVARRLAHLEESGLANLKENRRLAEERQRAAASGAKSKRMVASALSSSSSSSSKTISSANRRELQAALDVLEGVTKSGDGFNALCPAHDDTRPSLSISLGDDGRLLAHCFADCSFEKIVAAIRERQRGAVVKRADDTATVRVDPVERAAAERNSKIALRIWRETIPADKLIQAYLRERGITLPPPECLRYHEWLQHPDGWSAPAMVAAVQNVDGDIVAIHRTFFKPHPPPFPGPGP